MNDKSTTTARPARLEDLSPPCLQSVLSFLDPVDLSRSGRANKQLQSLSCTPQLWQRWLNRLSTLYPILADISDDARNQFLRFPCIRREPWWRVDDDGQRWKLQSLGSTSVANRLLARLSRGQRIQLRDGRLHLRDVLERHNSGHKEGPAVCGASVGDGPAEVKGGRSSSAVTHPNVAFPTAPTNLNADIDERKHSPRIHISDAYPNVTSRVFQSMPDARHSHSNTALAAYYGLDNNNSHHESKSSIHIHSGDESKSVHTHSADVAARAPETARQSLLRWRAEANPFGGRHRNGERKLL